jgi:hypothetical protein
VSVWQHGQAVSARIAQNWRALHRHLRGLDPHRTGIVSLEVFLAVLSHYGVDAGVPLPGIHALLAAAGVQCSHPSNPVAYAEFLRKFLVNIYGAAPRPGAGMVGPRPGGAGLPPRPNSAVARLESSAARPPAEEMGADLSGAWR